MNMDPRMIMNLIRQGQNPQQLFANMIQQQMGNSPMGQNLLKMIQSNDTSGIETFARNYLQQNGRDFDKEFSAFKQFLGIK